MALSENVEHIHIDDDSFVIALIIWFNNNKHFYLFKSVQITVNKR